MADIQRSMATLLTAVFQDGQADASITPQDLRDLIVSIGKPPFGSCFMSGNVTPTVIGSAGVYTKVLGTMAGGSSSSDVTLTGDRLTYSGASPRHFHIVANMSVIASGNNKVTGFCLAKNGTEFGAPLKRTVSTGSDIGAVSVHADVMLSANDYLEVFCTNYTDTVSITAEDMYFFAMGMST